MKPLPETGDRDSVTANKLAPTAGYYAAFLALGLMGAVIGPTLPGLAHQTGSQVSDLGILFTARSLGYFGGVLSGGRLYDNRPGHPLIGLMLLICASLMALIPFLPYLWLLMVGLLLMGLAEGVIDVGGNTLLVWLHGADVGPYMNGLHFCFGAGSFIAPVVVAQLVDLTWSYGFLALLILPGSWWLWQQPSPSGPQPTTDETTAQTDYRLVSLIGLFFFLYVGAEIGFGGWIFTYALAVNLPPLNLGWPPFEGLTTHTSAAYLTAAFWGSFTLARLLTIPLATKLRPRTLLLVSLLGCLFHLSLVLWWPHQVEIVWWTTVGLGCSMAAIFPTILSLAARHMTITARASSGFFAGASLGGMTLPWLFGQLFQISPLTVMLAITLVMVLDMVIFAGLMLLFKE